MLKINLSMERDAEKEKRTEGFNGQPRNKKKVGHDPKTAPTVEEHSSKIAP